MNRKMIVNALACALVAVIGACAIPGMPWLSGNSNSSSSSNHSSSTSTKTSESVKVNGVEVEPEDAPQAQAKPSGAPFGATCHHNPDCASNSCYVGYGNLGYCTKMCDSFSDCPSFWECKHVGNAPQKICQQPKD